MAAPRAARIAPQMNLRWRSAELICEAVTYNAKIELNGLEEKQKNGTSRQKYGKHFLTSAGPATFLHLCSLRCMAATTCPDSTYAYFATTSNQSNLATPMPISKNVRLNLICKIVIQYKSERNKYGSRYRYHVGKVYGGSTRDGQIKMLVLLPSF